MHPNLVKLFAAVLAIYGLYTLWLAVSQSAWFVVWSVPCLVGAVGLALSRNWSQYLYYLVALCTVVGWAVFVCFYVAPSWSRMPGQYIANLLVVGLVLFLFSVGGSIIIRQHFKHRALRT